MNLTALKKIVLSSALLITIGTAHADYTTYTQAIGAARPLYEAGDYVAAQRLAEKALTLAKTPAEEAAALIRIGATYNKRKLNVQAREQWAKVMEVLGVSTDDKHEAQFIIAASYCEDKDWKQSQIEFQKVVDAPEFTSKEKSDARFAIAGLLGNQGKQAEASDMLLSIGEDTTVDVDTRGSCYHLCAAGLSRNGKFDAANAIYEKALSLPGVSPASAIVYRLSFAASYERQGNKAKAQDLYSQAQVAAFRESQVLTANKQYAGARSTLKTALSMGKNLSAGTPAVFDASMRAEVGRLFLREGNPIEARGTFESLLQKTYGNDLSAEDQLHLTSVRQGAQLGIAVSYIQQQNKAKAQQLLEELLAIPTLDAAVKTAAEKRLKEVTE